MISLNLNMCPEEKLLQMINMLAEDTSDKIGKTLNSTLLTLMKSNCHLKVIKILLDDDRVDFRADNDYAIRWASEKGHLSIVKFLVEIGADIHAENDYAIRLASANGHIEVVKFLVEIRADIYAEDNYAIRLASENGHLEVVDFFMKIGVNPCNNDNHAIKMASKNGHTEVVKRLMHYIHVEPPVHYMFVDPTAEYNYAIKWASINGHIEVVKLLLQDQRIDPSANNNLLIKLASQYRQTDIVKLLIPKIDLSKITDKKILDLASSFGTVDCAESALAKEINPIAKTEVDPIIAKTEVKEVDPIAKLEVKEINTILATIKIMAKISKVKELLKLAKIGEIKELLRQLSAEEVLQLIKNCMNDYSKDIKQILNIIFKELIESNRCPKVIKFLLVFVPRVNPCINNNCAIEWASEMGHTDIVELLLETPEVDPCAGNNYAIRFASANGHTDIVKLLLNDKKVDPCAGNNYAIRFASANGHTEVVNLLMQRVDPSACHNTPIENASLNGHLDIVKLLLQDNRVLSGYLGCAISHASENGHLEVVKLLIPKIDLSKITNCKILAMAKEINEIAKIENKTSKNKSMEDALSEIIHIMNDFNISKISIDDMAKITLEYKLKK